MGQLFHIPTDEKVRAHSGKDRSVTYLEYATPREPSETRGILQAIQIIDEVEAAFPCFQTSFVHSRNKIGRSVEELESF